MQNASWITLLRLIPPQQFDNLVLTTASGVEINLQTLIRTEEEYVVFRGRLSGSTDTGRVFFVPYDQINFINFVKPVKEVEVNSFYDRGSQTSDVQPGATEAVGDAPSGEEAAAPAAPPPAGAPQPPSPLRTPLTGRSAILDRLRARVAPKQPDK